MSKFYEHDLTNDTIWRALILLGKNNKTYKFALAKVLLEFAKKQQNLIPIHELSESFANYMLEHVNHHTSQGVDEDKKGIFLIACEKYRDGLINKSELFEITQKHAFNDVIDRFHTLGQNSIPFSFYDYSDFKSSKKINLTNSMFELMQSTHGENLLNEVEARWKIVENAWNLNISTHLLEAEYDQDTQEIFVKSTKNGLKRRIPITSSRNTLNGYQKSQCFYCFNIISTHTESPYLAHVDHFFPHTLFDRLKNNVNYNAIWNLVLACSECNLKKQARIPKIKYVERLYKRNEFYIDSKSLLTNIVLETGATHVLRHEYLQQRYNEAKASLISDFETEEKLPARF